MNTLKCLALAVLAATLISCGPASQPSSPGSPKPTRVPSTRHIRRVLTSPLPAEAPYQDNAVAKTLAAMPAQCYLIDASGSMDDPVPGGSVKKIDVVRKFKFPENAIVYAFSSDLRGGGDALPFAQLDPDGGTPLYSSIINMLSSNTCKDLSVFTDGRDNAGRGTLDKAIAAALNAKVPVNVGAVGDFGSPDEPNWYQKQLLRLGCETGGKVAINLVDVVCPQIDVKK